jgi:hypothetical protein
MVVFFFERGVSFFLTTFFLADCLNSTVVLIEM